jgi:LmbE family N-acetylglucosaminyl deacetylase
VSKFLKINKTLFLDFSDNKMDLVSTLEIAKIIEREIIKNKYEIIYTHSSSDLNVDHRKICEATFVACRPVMGTSIEMVLTYEVPSSTEWGSLFYDKNFTPNLFRDIEDSKKFKLQALKLYEAEIRNFPHPRSILAIESLEIIRGSTVGFKYAEAYNLVYYRYTNT